MADKKTKISPEFTMRLSRLRPDESVRALVLLQTMEAQAPVARRQSRLQRRTKVAAIRQSAATAVAAIDNVLARFGGKRLSDQVSALGSVPVETTASGIEALAECDAIKAILEDQPISLLPRPKR